MGAVGCFVEALWREKQVMAYRASAVAALRGNKSVRLRRTVSLIVDCSVVHFRTSYVQPLSTLLTHNSIHYEYFFQYCYELQSINPMPVFQKFDLLNDCVLVYVCSRAL